VAWSGPESVCGGYYSVCIFFFQAEDGIRDATVTGVQTCALPIYPAKVRAHGGDRRCHDLVDQDLGGILPLRRDLPQNVAIRNQRSEERRVGKEWKARRAMYSQKTRNSMCDRVHDIETTI